MRRMRRRCRPLRNLIICRDANTGGTVPAELTYDPTNPYAVSVTFHPDSPYAVAWTFARDLLAGGLRGRAGWGDVRLCPRMYGRDAGRWMFLTLESPEGIQVLELPTQTVKDWLTRTYLVVPEGAESRWLDLDTVVSELLAGGAR